jgi:hypothetical protein
VALDSLLAGCGGPARRCGGIIRSARHLYRRRGLKLSRSPAGKQQPPARSRSPRAGVVTKSGTEHEDWTASDMVQGFERESRGETVR